MKTLGYHGYCNKTWAEKTKMIILIIIFFSSLGLIFAQTDVIVLDTIVKSSSGIIGAPYVTYQNETGIALGITGMYYLHLVKDTLNANLNRPSSIGFGVTYTQKKQFSSGLVYELYFNDNIYYIFGGIDFKRIPFDFFGVGNHSPTYPIDNYTPLWRGGDILLTRKIIQTTEGQGLNVGLKATYRSDIILKSKDGGILKTGNVPGASGGSTAGLGIVINYDTRDNIYSSQKGQYIDLRDIIYSKYFGSTYNFNLITLDVRDFIPLFSNQTMAFQGLMTLANGLEPFYTMAALGGNSIMRGYFEGRFRDNNMAVFQAEYRMPLFWIIGLAGFADIGEVAGTMREFDLSGLKCSAGAGIHFLVLQNERLVIRLDYGIGNTSSGIYLFFNEAF